MIHLFCATGNAGKLREFRSAAESSPRKIVVELLPGFRDIPPCIEDGYTFEENAILKGVHYGSRATGLVFAEDSGLQVDALEGAPGIHSARFAGPNATDHENNRLLLEKLQGVSNRKARYVCVIALMEGGEPLRTFRGTVEGTIATESAGHWGFGYDPLFYYPPFAGTFGEAAAERKCAVSHRGQAFRAMVDWLMAYDRT